MSLWTQPIAMRALVLAVIAAAFAVLGLYAVPLPENVDLAHVLFWIVVTLIASAQPVYLPRGVNVSVNSAPLIAALFDAALPRPLAPLLIAAIGTLQLRDIRHELPFYGTLYNRATFVLSVYAGWLAILVTGGPLANVDPFVIVPQLFVAGLAYSLTNQMIASAAASTARTSARMAIGWVQRLMAWRRIGR